MTPVWDLAYQEKTHSLYAASFGRGAYSLPLTGLTARPPQRPVTTTGPKAPTPDQGPIATTGLPSTLPLAALAALGVGLVAARRRRQV